MKYFYTFLTSVILLRSTFLHGQVFTGAGGPVNDMSVSNFDLQVSAIPSTLDTNYGLETVCLDIIHPGTGDLIIYLVCPDGTEIELTTGNGGAGNDYTTCFNDDSPYFIQNGSNPFTGIFHPEGAISYANNGQDGNGTWRLRISDTIPTAIGILNSWSLEFGSNPSQPFSSNLPIVKINTNGQVILDDPKVMVQMEIIHNGQGMRNYVNDPPNGYDGYSAIEYRGSSSQQFMKKSYGFETTDNLMEEINVSLLGMPAESDWILNATYSDKSLLRNVLAYHLSMQMGRYATRWRFCELFLDGQYRGIYILTEKIKRDNNRVDIANLTEADTTGDDLTGGYIIKIDKTTGSGGTGWTSSFPPLTNGPDVEFQYEYPSAENILPVQQNYIQSYIDSFETALSSPSFTDPQAGYHAYADAGSFIDYFLVNEISKNVDGYRISTFMYKDKESNGGLLNMGPAWDYDIAWGNVSYSNGNDTNGWSYQFNDPNDNWQVPFWWDRLLQDTLFSGILKCRWNNLRAGVLSDAYLLSFIDSMANYLDEAQDRNFRRWPILGVLVWPNPSPVPQDYEGELDYLKNYITGRMAFLDNNMPGVCVPTSGDGFPEEEQVIFYPNPANDHVVIGGYAIDTIPTELTIFSVTGKRISTKVLTSYNVDVSKLAAGVYIFELRNDHFILNEKIVISN